MESLLPHVGLGVYSCCTWDSSFQARDQTLASCIGISESWPLDPQGSPFLCVGFFFSLCWGFGVTGRLSLVVEHALLIVVASLAVEHGL